ncbi:alpha/beta fold hydrolase [Sneathiella chinensis]|uniref:3-oxoadipate enol-lactonase n=1 Tax=Sneathiella chinensis TaxID=349750 RepID=A0ABQ5U3C1_9PROT|nr:alpha/beta fold hydrolase [Sneathiella chinensis]GLQ06649.1 3-oxoadipate enol-lactonase [Sneathiella chinensis]
MFVTVNGNRFEALLEGPDGAPVVTLSHSLCTNLKAWDDLTEALVPDFRVLRYSMRGHGRSGATPGPYSLSGLAADVAALQTSFGITKSHFVGLSIGGMIAQTFALEHPERLDKLVIASSLCELPEGSAPLWAERIAAAQQNGIEALVEPTAERWFTKAAFDAGHPAIERARAMIRETSLEGYIGCCHAISNLDLSGRLPGVKAETLVIVGREDQGTPVAASERIAACIPGAVLKVVEEASHQVALEQPEIFQSTLVDFLKS